MIIKIIIAYFTANIAIWFILYCSCRQDNKQFTAKDKQAALFFGVPLILYEVVKSLKKK